jgi:hypothetical protein
MGKIQNSSEKHDSESFTFQALTAEGIAHDLEARTGFEKESNIADQVLDTLADIAQSNQISIILRPVNSTAYVLMKNGAAGKNIHVHGKSANKGLANGLIPIRSSISKAAKDGNVANIQNFNLENTHSLENSAKALREIRENLLKAYQRLSPNGATIDPDLLLKESGVSAEKFQELVLPVKLLDRNGNQIYIFENDQGLACRDEGSKDHIYAIKRGDGFIRINENHEEIGKIEPPAGYKPTEIEVLGKPQVEVKSDGTLDIKSVKPITADIDVLAYGFTHSESFQHVKTHDDILSQRKDEAIEGSKLIFDPNSRAQLMEERAHVIETRVKNLATPNSDDIKRLASTLQDQERQIDHYRGMGRGTDQTNAVLAHLREVFKDGVEISHGAEQFNLYLTQPLDSEWVVIKKDGSKCIARGEDELIRVFNETLQDGLQMHPNPNWGWKLNAENQYFIDPKYKELFDNIAKATAKVGPDEPKHIQDKKLAILNSRLELGMLAVTAPEPATEKNRKKRDSQIRKRTTALEKQYKQFERDLASPIKGQDSRRLSSMIDNLSSLLRRKSDPGPLKQATKPARSASI